MFSAIYEGRVRHRRLTPVEHAFDYPLFMMYLDLDELPTLFSRYMLWSNEGWGLARFRRRDHLRGEMPAGLDLRDAVRGLIRRRTGATPSGPIRLLTHLEYFGYRFNPVSFYFCHDGQASRPHTLVAEINNTPWSEQHCYVLPWGDGPTARLEFAKCFHISPFMPMDVTYTWSFSAPGASLGIHMEVRREGTTCFDATLAMRRHEISSVSLNGLLFRYPFMTARVITAIYWQALRLWLKGCPYVPHPDPPPSAQRIEAG